MSITDYNINKENKSQERDINKRWKIKLLSIVIIETNHKGVDR